MAAEQPDYEIIATHGGAAELRRYGAMIVAETVVEGDARSARSAGFAPLADYIFAKSRGGEPIAMTAPVTQTPAREIPMTAPVTQSARAGGDWAIRFIMPSGYAMETLPEPGPGVTLREIGPRVMAAIRFSGTAPDDMLAEKTEQLLAVMEEAGWRPAGQPVFAYYDAPYVPGFLRRNEVMIPVAD